MTAIGREFLGDHLHELRHKEAPRLDQDHPRQYHPRAADHRQIQLMLVYMIICSLCIAFLKETQNHRKNNDRTSYQARRIRSLVEDEVVEPQTHEDTRKGIRSQLRRTHKAIGSEDQVLRQETRKSKAKKTSHVEYVKFQRLHLAAHYHLQRSYY